MKNKIKYYRFMKGEITQAKLAEMIGVSRQTIIAIEKGSFNPSVKLALRLAALFEVKVEELFELEEDEK